MTAREFLLLIGKKKGAISAYDESNEGELCNRPFLS